MLTDRSLNNTVRRFYAHTAIEMNNKTQKALNATIRHFEDASKHASDPRHAIDATATGLVCLTGLIADLIDEIETLRSEIKSLRQSD